MKHFEFLLNISPQQYLPYYRGTVQRVVVQCVDGQVAQFPASLLQRFVSTEGIRGHFVLTCDDHYRSAKLERVPGSA